LKGKPVVVGADPKEGMGRGVVSRPPTKPGNLALDQLYQYQGLGNYVQNCVYLRPHFGLYVPASNSIMKIPKNHADKFEQGGIDEAYLDISNQVKDFDEAKEFAKRLMEDVLEKENLTC
jgi:DNA polymerase IV (archaeal DinB-like DNA polymerase)